MPLRRRSLDRKRRPNLPTAANQIGKADPDEVAKADASSPIHFEAIRAGEIIYALIWLSLSRELAHNNERTVMSIFVVRALLPAFVLIILAGNSRCQELTQQSEIWHGVIKTPYQWLRTTLYLTSKTDGGMTGYSVSDDQKAAKIPITKITRVDGKWAIELKSVNATFSGVEGQDGKSVAGGFTQNGTEFPLFFERVDSLPPMPASVVYRGELNAFIRKLPMQLRLIDGEKVDGKQLVLVDSLSEGFGSFVGTLETDADQLVIKVPGLAATWKGRAKLEDESWSGSWSQGLVPLPLEWKREAQPLELEIVKRKRPQIPLPPFPYDSTDVTIENNLAANTKLAGTLTLPKAGEKLAAVVLITGSGPQDRDETIVEHKPFLIIADHLARQGIAVLRYDDRGVGKSTGDFESAVTDDFIADAKSAWTLLSTHPRIDSSKIGLLGHSEGSSVAISVAAQNPKVAFLVLMAGAGWDGRKIVVEQTLEMARRQKSPDAILNALRSMMEQHSDLALRNINKADFEQQVDTLVDNFLSAADVPADAKATSKAALSARLKQLNTAWYRDFLSRNPSTLLPQLRLPILAVWGSEDVQVPAVGNRDSMVSALRSTNPLNQLEILPGLNHLLQPCKTGLVDEYETIETTIAPTALEKFSQFILKVTQ